MSVLTIALVIIIIGVLLWAVTTYIPMEPTIKKILVGVVILCLILWLLQSFGVLGSLNQVRVR